MKEKLIKFLREINSSFNTIEAMKGISEEQATEILKILEDKDLDDITLFYMGRCPYSIRVIKDDLIRYGVIQNTRYDSMVKLCYQLGYCIG